MMMLPWDQYDNHVLDAIIFGISSEVIQKKLPMKDGSYHGTNYDM